MSNEDWNELDESYRSSLSGALETAHPAVEQAGGDERAACNLWIAEQQLCQGSDISLFKLERNGALVSLHELLRDAYQAGQARAALAQPSPALPPFAEKVLAKLRRFYDCASDFESGGVDIGRHWLDLLTQLGLLNRVQRSPALWEISQQGEDLLGMPQPSPAQAEAERPEAAEVAFVLRNIGAMDAEDIDGDNVDLRFEDAEGRDTGCDVSIVEYAEKAADLLEQQDRIVGELRADRDSWAEQAEQRLADWDEMRKERDAALARVAEIELGIARIAGDFLPDNSGQAELALDEMRQALHELLAAAPTQAQHSGPETTNKEANSFLRVADAGQFKDNAAAVRTAAMIIRGLLHGPAIMKSIIRHRIGLTPEYEGQWHADLYGEAGEVQHHAEADTPDEAVRAVVALAAAHGKEGV